jgi:hypothetical protein
MRTRTTAPTLALVLVTALLGACGGGGGDDDGVASLTGAGSDGEGSATSTTLSEEEAQEQLLDWAECMREQGIDMPDPQISEDGGGVAIQIGGPPGGDDEGEDGGTDGGPRMDPEKFEAARDECGDPPMIGSFTEEDREEMEQQALEFAECMRDEGIEDFPDPDFSDFGPGRGPATQSSSDEEDEDGDGETRRVFGPWGEIDLEDPEVSAAFEACQETMGGGPGGRVMGPPVAVSGSAANG